MKITVLIENTSKNQEMISEHGLAFWIEYQDKYYLLDSGSSGAFMKNAEVLGIDLNLSDYAILSHAHYDHSGGFKEFVSNYPSKRIIASSLIAKKWYSKARGELHEIGVQNEVLKHLDHFSLIDKNQCLEEDVYLVFVSEDANYYYASKAKLYDEYLDYDLFKHECSLVFDTKKGLVIFNSCSHGGPTQIVSRIKALFPHRPLRAYLGGLHMKGSEDGKEICTYNDEEIEELCLVFENADVYTGHCTGSISYELLKNRLGNRLHALYSGLCINLE